MTKISRTHHKTKDGDVKKNPVRPKNIKKIYYATKEGNLITLKKGKYPSIMDMKPEREQFIVKEVQSFGKDKPLNIIDSFDRIHRFSSMDDYLNKIDWGWMRRNIEGFTL